MGFWSSLGKIGLSLIPGVGPVASKAIDVLGNVGDVAASVAGGRAKGRAAEADYGLQRDALAQRQAQANIGADSDRMRQAILLKLLQGGQDATVTPPSHIAPHMATVTGGPRISAIQGRGDIANAALPRIMESLFSGQHMPGLTPTPQANAFDKILSGLGTAGGFIGALGARKPLPAPPHPAPISNQSSVILPGGALPTYTPPPRTNARNLFTAAGVKIR